MTCLARKLFQPYFGFIMALALFGSQGLLAQEKVGNPYNLPLISVVEEYAATVRAREDKQMVDLKAFIPSLSFDIRYATPRNFVGKPMYPTAEAWLRKPAAEALKKVQMELEAKGIGLLVFDAYRPYSVTVAFYKATEKKEFVAHPKDGSRHNRGCAVDLTLVDLKTGLPLSMPTDFDDFTEKASPTYSDLPEQEIKNRQLLISTMSRHGFKVYYNEWWHFDFVGWEDFELMDISFKELKDY